MKWLSIKEYTPPACTNVFIRAINTGDFTYDRCFVGFVEDFTFIKNLIRWELEAHYDIDLSDYTVTHFAIIDPIEIEK
jgi:hypothetical protein